MLRTCEGLIHCLFCLCFLFISGLLLCASTFYVQSDIRKSSSSDQAIGASAFRVSISRTSYADPLSSFFFYTLRDILQQFDYNQDTRVLSKTEVQKENNTKVATDE